MADGPVADASGPAAEFRSAPVEPRLHISNIAPEVSEDELKDILEEVGPVKSLRLVQSEGSFQSAFCEYYDLPTAQAAQRNLDGALVQEVPVAVRFTLGMPNKEAEARKENDAPRMDPKSAAGLMISLPGLAHLVPEDSTALADALNSMNRSQLLNIMWQVKDAMLLDAKAVREVLISQPGLMRALFDAQQMLGLVKVPEEGGSEVTGPIMQQLLRMLKPLKADSKTEPAAQDKKPFTGRRLAARPAVRPPSPPPTGAPSPAPCPDTQVPPPPPPLSTLNATHLSPHERRSRGGRQIHPRNPVAGKPGKEQLILVEEPMHQSESKVRNAPEDLLKDPRLESLLHDTLKDPRLGSLLQDLPDGMKDSAPRLITAQAPLTSLPLMHQQPGPMLAHSQPLPNLMLPPEGPLSSTAKRALQSSGRPTSALPGFGAAPIVGPPPLFSSGQQRPGLMQMDAQPMGAPRPGQANPGVASMMGQQIMHMRAPQISQQLSPNPMVQVGSGAGDFIIRNPLQMQQQSPPAMVGSSFTANPGPQHVRVEHMPHQGSIVLGAGPSGPQLMNTPTGQNFQGELRSSGQGGPGMPWSQIVNQGVGGQLIAQVVTTPLQLPIGAGIVASGLRPGAMQSARVGKQPAQAGWRKRDNANGGRWRGGGTKRGRTGRGRIWRR